MNNNTVPAEALARIKEILDNLSDVLEQYGLDIFCNFECSQDHQCFVMKKNLTVVEDDDSRPECPGACMEYVNLEPNGIWVNDDHSKIVEN